MDRFISRGNEHVILGLFFRFYQCDSDDTGDGIGEEDDDGRTKTIISRTEYGQMIDFLKANPYVTREEYMWQWSIPQIRLACTDFTHIKYLSEEQAKKNKAKAHAINTAEDLMKMGVPQFK